MLLYSYLSTAFEEPALLTHYYLRELYVDRNMCVCVYRIGYDVYILPDRSLSLGINSARSYEETISFTFFFSFLFFFFLISHFTLLAHKLPVLQPY